MSCCFVGFQPFQEWSISNFPCSLKRNVTSHSRENLAFHHTLRWKMIILSILATSLIHFSLKCWENVTFWQSSTSSDMLNFLLTASRKTQQTVSPKWRSYPTQKSTSCAQQRWQFSELSNPLNQSMSSMRICGWSTTRKASIHVHPMRPVPPTSC